MGRQGVSSERRRSSCSSLFLLQGGFGPLCPSVSPFCLPRIWSWMCCLQNDSHFVSGGMCKPFVTRTYLTWLSIYLGNHLMISGWFSDSPASEVKWHNRKSPSTMSSLRPNSSWLPHWFRTLGSQDSLGKPDSCYYQLMTPERRPVRYIFVVCCWSTCYVFKPDFYVYIVSTF